MVMGLTMHERGKASLSKVKNNAQWKPTEAHLLPFVYPAPFDHSAQGLFASAMDELVLAEEAFALCEPGLTEGIDNVGLLLLDIVW